MDPILVTRLITGNESNDILEALWITSRIFINPIKHLIEASLICYMIYYQDKKNSKEGQIKKIKNEIKLNDSDLSSEYFRKIGISRKAPNHSPSNTSLNFTSAADKKKQISGATGTFSVNNLD